MASTKGSTSTLLPEIEDAEGDVDLGVDDALGGEGADHVVGDQLVVVGGAQAVGDGFEGFEEAEEVVVGVEGAGVGEGEGLASWRLARATRVSGSMVPSRWRWSSTLGRPRSQAGMIGFGGAGFLRAVIGE